MIMRSAMAMAALVALMAPTGAWAQASIYSTTPAPRATVGGVDDLDRASGGSNATSGASGSAALPGSPGTSGTTGTGSAGVGPTGTMASPGR
jgi:hypothetical protein